MSMKAFGSKTRPWTMQRGYRAAAVSSSKLEPPARKAAVKPAPKPRPK